MDPNIKLWVAAADQEVAAAASNAAYRKLMIETALLVASNRICDQGKEVLAMLLGDLNQLPPSFMREEFILLIEGRLAIREIAPIMEIEPPKPKPVCKQTKAVRCPACWAWNDPERFDCEVCGGRLS